MGPVLIQLESMGNLLWHVLALGFGSVCECMNKAERENHYLFANTVNWREKHNVLFMCKLSRC